MVRDSLEKGSSNSWEPLFGLAQYYLLAMPGSSVELLV
jgi:hypothetical protein